MPSPTRLLAVALLPAVALSLTVGASVDAANESGFDTSSPILIPQELSKREADPTVALDFVKRWAAIGDSFTAGIGSGKQMGSPAVGTVAWLCSRYSYSWPQIVDRFLGGSRADFQFTACSGDRSEGIYEQAQDLKGDLDLVMLTAGGNDLCLVCSPPPSLSQKLKS